MTTEAVDFDVVVVGAGLGGLYALHRFRRDGLRVVALESADSVGGVWLHNRYPGARVDLDSLDYCYFFSPEIFREWRWTERYAAQPELLAYLNFVTDRLDLRPHIRLNTAMIGAVWKAEDQYYEVTTSVGDVITARFLVMATGNLSDPRGYERIPGLDRFGGQWVQTPRWPAIPVQTEGRRVGVIGTGSSGVQTIAALAGKAAHLYVFQRTANYVVPGQNRPASDAEHVARSRDVAASRARIFRGAGVTPTLDQAKTAAEYTLEEREARMEAQWRAGGQGMNGVFADQATDLAVNDIVAEFVRNKVRQAVHNPELAEKLVPKSYPLGTRRLILEDNYYQAFNRDDVTLVDIKQDPIVEITETGVKTRNAHYELDVIVLALGFNAFTGAIDRANITNEHGDTPTSSWGRGPRTLLGLMTGGFPNLFMLTGPGSPSVLANMFLMNEFHVDWVADCLAHMNARRLSTIEPEDEAQDRWGKQVAEAARKVIRRQVDNYMVHVNEDGQRVFMPYIGGLGVYADLARAMADNGYEGFRFNACAETEAAR